MEDLKMIQKETWKKQMCKNKNILDEINGRLGFAVENIIKLEDSCRNHQNKETTTKQKHKRQSNNKD